METSKIGIFESISLLSELMPYYGSSPEGFLLLSLLSKSIRYYLLEHYPEYRRFMFKYAKMIDGVKDEHLVMKLPLDLFKISTLCVFSEETAELLVDLIRKLANKEGLYFGEHYMSDQICFEKVYVWPKFIPTLHPHIESLNSIKVFPFGGQDLSLQHSFLDLIVLEFIFGWKENKNKLNACFFKDSKLKKINPIYESFKRIKMISCDNYEDAFARLNVLKQTSIQEIDIIIFRVKNAENVEQITNQLLNYKIRTLSYDEFDNCESISNQTLEDISKIKPQKLHLSSLKSISTVFKIFLHLREDINVSFGRVEEWDPLKFEKALVIFKTKDDIIKSYCDKIGFSFEQDLIQENILFHANYVCISNFEEIHVENVKKKLLTTKTPLVGFSLCDSKNESCILIPKNNLSYIKLFPRDISNIFENEINATNFKSLSLKTKIIIELSSIDDLVKLNKLKEYFPEHSKLKISNVSIDIDKTRSDETILLDILSKFKSTSLEVLYLNLNCNKDKYEDILMSLLQTPSIQGTLEHFSISHLDMFKCTSVIDMLVEFNRIKTVKIYCGYSENDNFKKLKLEIKQFEKKLKKKHSEIQISINYYPKINN